MAGHAAAPLALVPFSAPEDPLVGLPLSEQRQYLRSYLAELGACTALVEPSYFDRDYLSEFAAFYCTSTAGYPNVCRRVHYFSVDVDRSMLEAAVGGDEKVRGALQDAYLGFVILRPIPKTPIGRTVLRAFDDATPHLPRIVNPFRRYTCNVAGLELRVTGLAWQQQDTGVGACATVALWSMLHTSAFDDRHVIPTTAEITRVAHGAGLSSYRAFPSRGLNLGQLIATLRDFGFAPLLVPGDRPGPVGSETFTAEHFSASLAAFVRSGYSVLVAGTLLGPDGSGQLVEAGRHAVCAVGFRQVSPPVPLAGALQLEDAEIQHVYLHDDNIGTAARHTVEVHGGAAVLRYTPPVSRRPVQPPSLRPPGHGYLFRPSAMIAAAHDDVRLSTDTLRAHTEALGKTLIAATGGTLALMVSTHFTRVTRYMRVELAAALQNNASALGPTRLALWERVPPMPLHIGLVRFGGPSGPLFDVLYDTSDSEPNLRALCHVAFHPSVVQLIQHVEQQLAWDLGTTIEAY